MSGTTNLGIPYIQASQNQKEVTANAAFDALDKALTETFDANLASANVTLTDAQYRQALAVRAQNATVAGRTVTLPARERLTVLVMDGSCTQEVGFVRGSTTLSLAPGQAVLARTDGSTNGLVALIRGSAATPVSTFLALADTPASYAGQGGRALRVNAGGTALEFTDVAAASHTHDAGDITGGTVDTARFGSGTADASTFLRGDQAWVAPTLAGLSDGPGGLSVAPGQLLQVNAGGTAVEFGLLHNMAATTDPGAADDIGDGYAIGSIWFNRARDTLWLCQDASAGTAIWQPYLSRRALHGGYGTDPDQVMASGPLNGTSAAGVTAVDRLYLRPFRWFGGRSIDRLFGRVTTAGTASNIKFGLWGHDYGAGRPTGLPLGANNTPLSTATTGIKSAAIPAVDPAPGILWVASIHEGTTTPGMQAAPAGHFDVWEFVPIPGGDFSLLVGAANQGSYGLICNDFTFAADITAIDLTSATFARSSGNAAIHPHVMIGF